MYYSTEELDRIRQLKESSPFTGFTDIAPNREMCKIKILGRGEVAFYQQGSKAMLLEVIAGYGVIFAHSIRQWDNKKKVTVDEREIVIDVMTRVMQKLGATEVRVVRAKE